MRRGAAERVRASLNSCVTRALALQQAPQVPGSLVEALLADAQGFLARA